MGDVTSLTDRRRRRDIEARMDQMAAAGYAGLVDISDLTLEVDAALAEISASMGITIQRVAPIARVDGEGGRDNVIPLRPVDSTKQVPAK